MRRMFGYLSVVMAMGCALDQEEPKSIGSACSDQSECSAGESCIDGRCAISRDGDVYDAGELDGRVPTQDIGIDVRVPPDEGVNETGVSTDARVADTGDAFIESDARTSECEEGQVRPCGDDTGACAFGQQACEGGSWKEECVGAVGPSEEACNNEDDDCDGRIDEDLTQVCGRDLGNCAVRMGARTCEQGEWSECMGAIQPVPEVCNNEDDDCDGTVDESLQNCCEGVPSQGGPCCEPGQVRACGPAAVGICMPGMQMCDVDGTGWGDCVNAVEPQEREICQSVGQDQLDEDCDGEINEGFESLGNACSNGVGACERAGTIVCMGGGLRLECDAQPGQPEDEICNNEDDDCDGDVDENFNVGEPCTNGMGICARSGEFICGVDGNVICNAEIAQVQDVEICNNEDDDCDGDVDEDVGRICGEQCGIPGIESCVAGEWTGICEGQGMCPEPELCDGVDNDLDQIVDEECPELLGDWRLDSQHVQQDGGITVVGEGLLGTDAQVVGYAGNDLQEDLSDDALYFNGATTDMRIPHDGTFLQGSYGFLMRFKVSEFPADPTGFWALAFQTAIEGRNNDSFALILHANGELNLRVEGMSGERVLFVQVRSESIEVGRDVLVFAKVTATSIMLIVNGGDPISVEFPEGFQIFTPEVGEAPALLIGSLETSDNNNRDLRFFKGDVARVMLFHGDVSSEQGRLMTTAQ